MALCQVEAVPRFRITSPLQAGKKLGPHHKFDFFSIYYFFFLLFRDAKVPQIHLSATFSCNEFN
jgi:hypothetical protein